MAESVSQTCDVCGKRKLETNHWFRVALIIRSTGLRLLIGRWEDTHFPKPHWHLCGAECLSKKTSAFAGGDISVPGERAAS